MAKPLVPDELWNALRPLLPPQAPPLPLPRTQAHRRAQGAYGHPFRPQDQHPLGGPGRLRDWNEAGVWPRLHQALLARLDDAHLINWTRAAIDATFARALGGVEGRGRNPTDWGRPGVKQHVLVDANGILLAGDSTPANVPEVKELLPLVDGCGARDEDEEPRRPRKLYGDRAYGSEPHREQLRKRGIEPKLAKRKTAAGGGLGVYRWVVERTISWLHGFRKLRLVTEKTQEMQYAFLNLALALICYWCLETSFC